MLAKVQLSSAHGEWLAQKRKIDVETATRLHVISQGPNIAFQFRQNGALLYTKARIEMKQDDGSLRKIFRAEPQGIQPILWNYDCLLDAPSNAPMIMTEGEFDACSFEACGMNAVSVPNGAQLQQPGEGDIDPNEDRAFGYLWRNGKLDANIAKFRKIIIAVDADKTGRILGGELATRLDRRRCWHVAYPNQIVDALGRAAKDANEVLVHHGPDALADLIGDAKPLASNTLVTYGSIPVDDRPWLSAGWRGTDPHLRIRAPQLGVLTGIPGHGKTQFALGIGANLAYDHKRKGVILQLEDSAEKNREDLIAFYKCRKGTEGINNPAPDDYHRALERITTEEALAWVDRMFVTVTLDETDADLDPFVEFTTSKPRDLVWLKEMLREAAIIHGCSWGIVDPWNEVEHLFSTRSETEVQYIGRALRELKALTRRFSMTLLIVAHTDKAAMRKQSVEDLDLADVAGGGIWFARADLGIVVFMPDVRDPIRHVRISKTKDWKRMGKPGIVQMRFRSAFATWEFVKEHEGKSA